MAATRLLALVALVALTSGCGTPASFTYDRAASDPLPERVALPRPVRLGVMPYRGSYQPRHQAVLEAFRRDPGFELVQAEFVPEAGIRVDYMLELSYGCEVKPKPYNFFICFPGFVLFAPSWAGLRWDYRLPAHVELRRYPNGSEVAKLAHRQVFHARYTPTGAAVGSYIGFAGLIFFPAVASPFITGIATAMGDWTSDDLERAFVRSGERDVFARHVVTVVAAEIERDLREP